MNEREWEAGLWGTLGLVIIMGIAVLVGRLLDSRDERIAARAALKRLNSYRAEDERRKASSPIDWPAVVANDEEQAA